MTEITCPDCRTVWPDQLAPCPGCGLSWDDIEDAVEYLDRVVFSTGSPWPLGILSRVSREAYNAVSRARGFQFMTPEEREAAAISYDQLSRRRQP